MFNLSMISKAASGFNKPHFVELIQETKPQAVF